MFGFVLHLIKIMPISDGMQYGLLPLVAGILGGAQVIGGIAQALSSSNRKREPKYEIPKEVFEATEMAKEAAKTGMPSAALEFEKQAIDRSSLMAQRAAADRRAGLATINTTIAQRDLSLASLAARNANIMQQNQRFAQQALMTQAQFRDKAFANQWQSWANAEQQRIETRNAGFQNMMGGLTSIGTMASMGAFGNNVLGSGSAPGIGGSTYNPMSQFLTGNIPNINYVSSSGIQSPTYNLNPSYLSLYRGPQSFNSSILRTK